MARGRGRASLTARAAFALLLMAGFYVLALAIIAAIAALKEGSTTGDIQFAGFFPYVVDSSSRDLPWAPKINRISST